ncbi:MAG: HAD family hydrolase [Bacilli bacterium]|nr:HAD family hydrolase [Bacilli bacterium]
MKDKQYLIAVDLDGTLLSGFDQYDDKSFELLKGLAKEHYVVIATGRPLRSSKYYYDLLGLDTPIINYNGALVHNPAHLDFPKQMVYIEREDLFQFLHDNEALITNAFCEIEDDIYLYRETKEVLPYLHLEGGNLRIGHLEEILPSNPNGAIIFSHVGSESILENYVHEHFNGRVQLRFWYVEDTVVSEFYNPITSKAHALRFICNHYHIAHEFTIAIGDGHNDIEMIEFAKYGVAMGNAHPDLIKSAKYLTSTIQENGVYYFLNSFFNENGYHQE